MQPLPDSRPEFWKVIPDPQLYFSLNKTHRKWNLRSLGYCACRACIEDNGGNARVVSLRQYRNHVRDAARAEEYAWNVGRPTPAANVQTDSTSASLDTSPWPFFSAPADRTTESALLVVHGEESDPLQLSTRAIAQQPAEVAMDLGYASHRLQVNHATEPAAILQPVLSPVWRDFIDDYVACTEPIDISLMSPLAARPVDRVALTVLEKVIYGTNVALAGHWNLPHAAVQFNMTQSWNLFQYGLLLGRLESVSIETSSAIGHNLGRLTEFDTVLPAVRTLRSAERHLSPDYADVLVIHAACTNVNCQHVFYSFRCRQDFKIGTVCDVCKIAPDNEKNFGLVPFPRMPLPTALQRFLQIEGIEELCEKASFRMSMDEELDARIYPNLKIYRDAYSGSAWNFQTLQGQSVPDDDHLVLRLNIGIDWYQPSRSNHARLQSVGPIIAHVVNLPLKVRASMSLALLLGITPGPSEIRGENVHKFLLPLCLELREARLYGFHLKTPKHPEGRRVYVSVAALCCDGPARTSVTGGPHFSRMGQFCTRCSVKKKDLLNPETCQWHVRPSFLYTGRVYAERRISSVEIRDARLEHQRRETAMIALHPKTIRTPPDVKMLTRIKKAVNKTPGHISAFDIVPMIDKNLSTIFDPMHMVCMGLIKNFFKNMKYTGDKYRRESRPNPPSAAESSATPSTTTVPLSSSVANVTGTDGVTSARARLASAQDDDKIESESSEEDDDPVPAIKPAGLSGSAKDKPKKKKKGKSLLTESQKDLYHVYLNDIILPPHVETISAMYFFKGAYGTTTAAQWRTFARYYAPMATIRLWTHNQAMEYHDPSQYNPLLTEHDLHQLMLVCQIADLSLRPTVSSKQLNILRRMTKELQDNAYRERPDIIRCANLHWLSHLPDDIERYGPVYSYWLFGFERMNKLLKGANNNGHPTDTPLIAFHKFLRMGSLGLFGTFQASDGDVAGHYLATQSELAFQQAIAFSNSIAEQEEAQTWQEERPQGPQKAERALPSVLKVEKSEVHPLIRPDLEQVCRLWNKEPSAARRVRTNDSRMGPFDPSILVLSNQALVFRPFSVGRLRFRTASPHSVIQKPLIDTDCVNQKGAFFEWRTDREVFYCFSRRAPVGLLDYVFEATAHGADGYIEKRWFMKIHMLTEFSSNDPYQFRLRIPQMNIWLWQPRIANSAVVALDAEKVDWLKPVIIGPLPSIPGQNRSPTLWAVQSIDSY